MAVNAQFILKPTPGTDLGAAIANVREGALLWRKHGAAVSLWTVSMGEIGNMIFEARFDSYENYAKCYERLIADPAFSSWMQKLTAEASSTWLRSNLCREIPV